MGRTVLLVREIWQFSNSLPLQCGRTLWKPPDTNVHLLIASVRLSSQIISLENEILRYKTEESNHTIERENDKRRIDELTEENYVLQMSTKSSLSESHSIRAEMQVLKEKRGKAFQIRILVEYCRYQKFERSCQTNNSHLLLQRCPQQSHWSSSQDFSANAIFVSLCVYVKDNWSLILPKHTPF